MTRGGQPSSACKFVLVGLANHAGPDGTGAFPSAATLVRYTGLSERTVRTCLDRLEAAGIIRPCDPGIVAARIKRADRRPQGWNLNLGLIRDDLDDTAIAVLEHQFPGLGIRLAAAAPPTADAQPDGVQSPHPESGTSEAVDNRPNEVQQLHLAPGTECNHRIDGVQQMQLRGAGAAPEPSKELSAASAHARQVPATADTAGGGQAAGEFFRRPRGRLEANCRPAGQACPGRAGRARRGLVAAGAGGVHWREHRRRAQPVCGTGRPALARRTATTAAAATCTAVLVRPVRPGHADAGFRR